MGLSWTNFIMRKTRERRFLQMHYLTPHVYQSDHSQLLSAFNEPKAIYFFFSRINHTSNQVLGVVGSLPHTWQLLCSLPSEFCYRPFYLVIVIKCVLGSPFHPISTQLFFVAMLIALCLPRKPSLFCSIPLHDISH